MIAAAVIAVAALAVGGVVLLGGGDEASSATTTTTAAPTTSSTSTTTTSTVPPTTAPPTFDDRDLEQAMPGPIEIPDGWSQYSTADRAHDPDEDGGLCYGPNPTSLALEYGSVAGIDGPTFDLADGGWFGIEAYGFEDVDDAAAFIGSTIEQANCGDDVKWTIDESALDIFQDGYGDTAMWNLSESSWAEERTDSPLGTAANVMRQDLLTTTVDGSGFSYRYDHLVRYEQYGTVVVLYWLDGQYDYMGFDNPTEWAYRPTPAVLSASVDAVRDLIIAALAA